MDNNLIGVRVEWKGEVNLHLGTIRAVWMDGPFEHVMVMKVLIEKDERGELFTTNIDGLRITTKP